MTPGARLRQMAQTMAECAPAGACVELPVDFLAAAVAELDAAHAAPPAPAGEPRDLTVADLCERLGRRESYCRGLMRKLHQEGRGAYLDGREWKIPPADFDRYREEIREQGRKPQTSTRRTGQDPAAPVDLGSWRAEREGAQGTARRKKAGTK